MVMVQNTYGTKLQFCGTKWLWCKIYMVRNCNFVVRNGKLWYEMAMVRNDLLRNQKFRREGLKRGSGKTRK